MSGQDEVTTNELLQEIAELSERLNQLRPGVGSIQWCPKCWHSALSHKGGTTKGCKSKQKWAVEEFTRALLQQRNNLVAVIRAANTEAKQTDTIERLKATVERQEQAIESARERNRGLQASKEVIQGLLGSLNKSYLSFMTGGAIDDMKRIFAEVEELLTSLNAESKSSSEAEDDGEDDGDDGGDWDYSANLQWPPSNNTVVADDATLFPSSESTHISSHGEAGATANMAGADSTGAKRKQVVFSLSPPSSPSKSSSGHTTSPTGQRSNPLGQNTGQASRISGGILRAPSSVNSVYSIQGQLQPQPQPVSQPAPAPPSSPEYPGLKDKPGVILMHSRGGSLCGGEADSNLVVKAPKLIDVEFQEGMEPLKYLE